MILLIDADLVAEIGHTWVNIHGYVLHGMDNLVHRYVAAKVLGRKLKSTEHVHHINGNKLDNRRKNLLICSNSYHQLIHARQDTVDDGYNPSTHHYCTGCKEYHLKEMFPKNKNAWNGVHNMCLITSNKARRGKGYGKFDWKKRMQQQYRRSLVKGLVTCLDKEGRGQ